MDSQAQQQITPELFAGEQLIWAGRPQRGLKLRAHDAFMIPFGVIWCTFMVGAFSSAGNNDQPPFFVWPIMFLFVLIGIYLVFGHLVVDAYQRQNSFYGITNQRAIMVYGAMARRVKSLMLATLNDVTLIEKSNSQGTIMFGPEPPWYMQQSEPFMLSQGSRMAFEFIDDARAVYALIQNTHAKAG